MQNKTLFIFYFTNYEINVQVLIFIKHEAQHNENDLVSHCKNVCFCVFGCIAWEMWLHQQVHKVGQWWQIHKHTFAHIVIAKIQKLGLLMMVKQDFRKLHSFPSTI